MTGSHDSKLTEILTCYKQVHTKTPTEYAERFMQTGDESAFLKVLSSLPKLEPDEKLKFKGFIAKVLADEKFPTEEKISTAQGHKINACLLLYYSYSLLFSDKNPKRFDSFLEVLAKIKHPLALTLTGIGQLGTAAHATGMQNLEAARHKSPHAKEFLASLYMTGQYNIDKDSKKTSDYLISAKTDNWADAYYALASMELEDELESKDRNPERVIRIFDYLKKAAALGHTESLILLAKLYRLGTLGTNLDRPKAFLIYDTILKYANPYYTREATIALARTPVYQGDDWLWAKPPRDAQTKPADSPYVPEPIELDELEPYRPH